MVILLQPQIAHVNGQWFYGAFTASNRSEVATNSNVLEICFIQDQPTADQYARSSNVISFCGHVIFIFSLSYFDAKEAHFAGTVYLGIVSIKMEGGLIFLKMPFCQYLCQKLST